MFIQQLADNQNRKTIKKKNNISSEIRQNRKDRIHVQKGDLTLSVHL